MEQQTSNSIIEVTSGISSPTYSVSLSSDSGIQSPGTKKERRPKRVLHCSDGIYEEFSSDEEGVYSMSSEPPVDPKSMTWAPWLAHVSNKALAVCDSVGERVADFLGITSPKYIYEIEEAARMEEEAKAERREYDIEMAGWSTSPVASHSAPQTSTPVSTPPQMSADTRSTTKTDTLIS